MFFPLSKTISDTVMLLQLRAHTISKAGFASLASCPAGLLCDLPGAGGHVLRPVNPVVKDRLWARVCRAQSQQQDWVFDAHLDASDQLVLSPEG